MILSRQPVFPSAGRYVLRLHRDASPQAGRLSGRIEHVTSGENFDFASGEELLEWLTRHSAQELATPPKEIQP